MDDEPIYLCLAYDLRTPPSPVPGVSLGEILCPGPTMPFLGRNSPSVFLIFSMFMHAGHE